jgi:hypothetical protein
MRRARFFATGLLRASLLLFAAASPDLGPEELYARGGYLAAAEAGVMEGGGAGYALAARATLADATLRAMPCIDCLRRAQELARRGIAVDADYAEGYIEMAAAMGFEARIIGPLRSRIANYPQAAKNAIDKALELDPGNPWALSAAGGWNIEVVRLGGSILGGIIYGARFEDGTALYRKAMAADPGNLVIALNYALAVTSYDFEGKRLEIMAVLEAVVRGEPRDAYAQAMKERAAMLLDLLIRDKRDEYQALARRYLGFP